ncbi:MAG: TerB family tellurite resistance protein [Hyphomonadaceae bacterium]|nr:TerB family tellurite resistance protein [Hyphomonadaceae bacterium]
MAGPTPEHRAFVEASLGVVMSMIMADGKYTQDEFVWFKAKQHHHPLYRDVPPDVFNTMLRRVKARLTSEPWKALIDEWVQAVPVTHRLAIFELATELAVVDKELEGKEPEVVRYLWRALQIPDDEARRIFMQRIEEM